VSSFGGDPDSVCLVGEGQAGAAYVGAHLASKKSAGLFHRLKQRRSCSCSFKVEIRAILMSGSLASPVLWPLHNDEEHSPEQELADQLTGGSIDKLKQLRYVFICEMI